MLELLKNSYLAIRQIFCLVVEGKEMLVEGVEELNRGMEKFNVKLKNKNIQLLETRPIRNDIHRLKLYLLAIENHRNKTHTKYVNLHRFFDLSKEFAQSIIDILQMAIDSPKHRPIILNLRRAIVPEILSVCHNSEEVQSEFELMYSNGLCKNSDFLESFLFFLEFHTTDELEMKLKLELPNMIENYETLKTKLDGFKVKFQ